MSTVVKHSIRMESPREQGVRELIEALDSYLSSLYPPESNHFLDLEQLAQPDMRLFVARRDGVALACGALRIDGQGYGEVKRMYVFPAARGTGLGRAILAAIEGQASREKIQVMRLETGIRQAEALALYRSAGYRECKAFGPYRPDPLSLFLEKKL
jgi:putative acetyltransferase